MLAPLAAPPSRWPRPFIFSIDQGSWAGILSLLQRPVKPPTPTGGRGQAVHRPYIRLLITFGKCSPSLEILADQAFQISLTNEFPRGNYPQSSAAKNRRYARGERGAMV